MVAALSTVVVLLLIGAATIHLAYLEKMISRRYVSTCRHRTWPSQE